MAIAHAHLAASLALTSVGLAPDPADLPETHLFLPAPSVPAVLPMGSASLAAAVAAAFTDPRHDRGGATARVRSCSSATGAIAVGPDLETAGDRLELVDLLCRVHRDVRAAAGGASGTARGS